MAESTNTDAQILAIRAMLVALAAAAARLAPDPKAFVQEVRQPAIHSISLTANPIADAGRRDLAQAMSFAEGIAAEIASAVAKGG